MLLAAGVAVDEVNADYLDIPLSWVVRTDDDHFASWTVLNDRTTELVDDRNMTVRVNDER